MAISVGFFKYVYKWITDSESTKPVFRPFESDLNPYKANVFIVGSHPTPMLDLTKYDVQQYANALVNRNDFLALFPDYYRFTSREVKGAIRFSEDLLALENVTSVVSYINSLASENLANLKQMRKTNEELYYRGQQIFVEVIEEMKPKIVLLHGNYALEQFRKNFAGYYIEYGSSKRPLSELESMSEFGKIIHEDGSETALFATKSLSFYKEADEQTKKLFKQFKTISLK